MKQMRELTDLQFALVLVLPIIAYLLSLVAYPLGYALWLSVHKVGLFRGMQFQAIGLQNYVQVISSPDFWHCTWISLRFAAESLVLTMAIGLGIALVLSIPFRGNSLVRTLAALPWALPQYGTGVLFKYLFRGKSGVLTALAYAFGVNQTVDFLGAKTVIEAMAIANAWNLAPLVGLFVLANLQTIPSRLYDMAKLDKLGPLRQFWYVTLPYLRYTLFVFCNVVLVLSLKAFDLIYVQTGGGPANASATLTYRIYRESFVNMNLGYGAAMSFYLLFLIVLATVVLYVVWGRKEMGQ